MTPLQSGDHPILVKLHDEILPWVIAGRLMKRQWFVYLATIYGYVGDLGSAMVGLGLGGGLANLLQGKATAGQSALDVLRASLPTQFFVPGVMGLVVYVAMRVVVAREEVVAKALMAKEYSGSIEASYGVLKRALVKDRPMDDILAAQKEIDARVQDAVRRGVWPFDPEDPAGPKVDRRLLAMVEEIRSKYMSRWAAAPQGDRR